MGNVPLTIESEFLVKEEKILVYILSFLFTGMFLYGLIDIIIQDFKNVYYLNFIFLAAIIPAFYFFKKGRSNRIYIRINKTGIYQDERLVTGWPYFIDAYITQKKTTISIRDNFLLVVEYQKPGMADGFRRKMPLTNTQDKSEEEVLAAIKFFWKASRNAAGN